MKLMLDARRRDGAPGKKRWPFARGSRAHGDRCIACGARILSLEDALLLQGERFHAACALYSPRRRPAV